MQGHIKLWDAYTGSLLATIQSELTCKPDTWWDKEEVSRVTFSDKPFILYSGSRDSAIKEWDITTLVHPEAYIHHETQNLNDQSLRPYIQTFLKRLDEACKNSEYIALSPVEKILYEALPTSLKNIFNNIITA